MNPCSRAGPVKGETSECLPGCVTVVLDGRPGTNIGLELLVLVYHFAIAALMFIIDSEG